MKRICLLGVAIASLFIIGAATALAAAPHAKSSSKSKKTPGTTLKCSEAFTLQVPAGDTDVTAGATQGSHAGAAICALKALGKGAETDSFTTDNAGDLAGKWQQWFGTGTVFGTYTLAQAATPPTTTTSFAAASYTGTFVIKGGTGTFAKASGKGTMTCTTNDSVHYACKQKGNIDYAGLTAKS